MFHDTNEEFYCVLLNHILGVAKVWDFFVEVDLVTVNFLSYCGLDPS